MPREKRELTRDHNHCWVCQKPMVREPKAFTSFCSEECKRQYDTAYRQVKVYGMAGTLTRLAPFLLVVLVLALLYAVCSIR